MAKGLKEMVKLSRNRNNGQAHVRATIDTVDLVFFHGDSVEAASSLSDLTREKFTSPRNSLHSAFSFRFSSHTHKRARTSSHVHARRSIRQALELPPSSTPQFYHVRRSREDWGNPSPRWINKNRGRRGIWRRNLSTRYRLPDLRNALEKIEDISLVYQECTSQSWKSGRDERYFQPIPLSLPLRLVFYTFSFSFPFLSSFSSPLSFSLSLSPQPRIINASSRVWHAREPWKLYRFPVSRRFESHSRFDACIYPHLEIYGQI